MSSHKVDLPSEYPSLSRDPSTTENSASRDHKIALDNLYDDDADGTIDQVYQAKARILNAAIQDIGMGKYQVYLFCCAGFGWFADSVWPVRITFFICLLTYENAQLITGLILTPVINEFNFQGPFLTLAANVGLLVGAIIWSFGCDIWGRRWSFNLTLLIAGVFGLAAGGSQNMVTLASLIATLGVGVGGNMPVDSAVFLDLVPGTHQYLLTVMSIWWCLGQLVVSLLAWPLIANFSCQGPENCTRSENMGWRYLLFILGALTLLLWGIRFFVFQLFESPRFLIGIGKDAEAVEVIQKLAKFNSKTSNLTVEQLVNAGGVDPEKVRADRPRVLSASSALGWNHVKALFRTRKMAFSTSLLIFLWGIIGLASTLYNSFLPFLLESRGNAFGDGSLFITYRNTFILSVIGVPGAFLAGWAVELPYIGRKGTLALSSGEQGSQVPFFSRRPPRGALMLCSDGTVDILSLVTCIMYGVLYAISPEIFPAKDRGTGNGLVSSATRIFSVIAPIIALFANLETATPVYISGALIILAGFTALLLPYEPRGRASI
ncbi:major facilitator superfamily domain-containing protein [Rhodocollybia butyracea]|uniref:Major facilitator superfamily domain-containing protein n=1 Tax=Rhodocollybia butyracea TaxID=206335 RepID=A0A9P5PMR8_9AGAR|nr:major facilitator superfamily domain-containing protein [Rhodocollybia butyracea]